MDIEDIRIPELPSGTVELREDDVAASAMLCVGGKFYSITVNTNTTLDEQIVAVAKRLVFTKMQQIETYRESLVRTKLAIEQAKAEMLRDVKMNVMHERHAMSGLKVWELSEGRYGVEKPIVYNPVYVSKRGQSRDIVPGQIQPRVVIGSMIWTPSTQVCSGLGLFALTGERFAHYHSQSEADCLGSLAPRAKNYDELLAVYDTWEKQLMIINFDSPGNQQPMGMPHIRRIKVYLNRKEGAAWKNPTATMDR